MIMTMNTTRLVLVQVTHFGKNSLGSDDDDEHDVLGVTEKRG